MLTEKENADGSIIGKLHVSSLIRSNQNFVFISSVVFLPFWRCAITVFVLLSFLKTSSYGLYLCVSGSTHVHVYTYIYKSHTSAFWGAVVVI